MKSLALVLCSVTLTGCLASSGRTVEPTAQALPSAFGQFVQALTGAAPGLAPHDPRDPAMMFQQIPAWDRAAFKRCCSALNRTEFITARCDTDQPVPGRTNRC